MASMPPINDRVMSRRYGQSCPSSVHNAPRGEPHLRDVVDAAGEAATMKGMALRIPGGLAASCHKTPQRAAWLLRLPHVPRNLGPRWAPTPQAPFHAAAATCSYP